MERGTHHYKQIIGGNQEETESVSTELQELFDEKHEKFAENELEKTPEDIEILTKIESIVDKMVAQYGGDPRALPLDHIYIFKPGGVLLATEGRIIGGVHNPLGSKIGVDKGESKLLFASTIAHELFHLKSYKSARVGKSGEGVHLYRSGLSLFDRKSSGDKMGEEKEYFAMLEEAIVAECTKRFLNEISKELVVSEETTAFGKLKDWIAAYYYKAGVPKEKVKEFEEELKYISNPQSKVMEILAYSDDEGSRRAYAAGMFKALREKGEIVELERYTERKKLYELLDKLVVNSGGKFKEKDKVFDEFAKANFSGNYLPLAKMIEGILGKGSFRKLAEDFSKEPKGKE